MDPERQYFIRCTGTTVRTTTYVRERWRAAGDRAENMNLEIPADVQFVFQKVLSDGQSQPM